MTPDTAEKFSARPEGAGSSLPPTSGEHFSVTWSLSKSSTDFVAVMKCDRWYLIHRGLLLRHACAQSSCFLFHFETVVDVESSLTRVGPCFLLSGWSWTGTHSQIFGRLFLPVLSLQYLLENFHKWASTVMASKQNKQFSQVFLPYRFSNQRPHWDRGGVSGRLTRKGIQQRRWRQFLERLASRLWIQGN